MSALQVFTARISSRDPDRFDITRKSGGAAGEPFAPSWAILKPALADMRAAKRIAETDPDVAHFAAEAAWARYVPRFMAEMRMSYSADRAAWGALLARSRVVLVCYCTDPERCHRTLLARDILPKLGATYAGEIGGAS